MKTGIYVFFFLSGCSALIYEVVWMRMLNLTLGVTSQATACILAVFLGGLALGALLGGRLAERLNASTLIVYGMIELSVAVVAPITTSVTLHTPQLFASILSFLPEQSLFLSISRIALSSILLLPPTVLMGASLPLLTKFLTARHLDAYQFFSQLYGINTIGGAIGSLFACYFGLTYLGLSQTVCLAAAINFIVGISACFWGIYFLSPANKICNPSSSVEEIPENRPYLTPLYLIATLTGFTAISYEVLWTRMLQLSCLSTTYTFTAIVSMFLIGLALGSFLYNKSIGNEESANMSMDKQLARFAKYQFLAAIACGFSLISIPFAFLTICVLPSFLSTFLPTSLVYPIQLTLIAFVFMFIPSILIGISFPMITSMSTTLTTKISRVVGNTFALNTIGCVLGSWITGLALIPAIGSYTAFQLIMVINVLTGSCAIYISRSINNKKVLIALPLLLVISFMIFVKLPFKSFLPGSIVESYSEDAVGTVIVFNWPDHKQLFVNGDSYANTIMRGRRYMRVLGHLPVLLHSNPEKVLVICFGIGTTAGAISLHPEIKQEDIVELSPAVLHAAGEFSTTNYNVLANPKVHTHIDDGRNFLLRSKDLFDVITLEPPPSGDAGMANLYSREFYNLLNQHLKAGGLICQWAPMYSQSGQLWKMMVKSAQQEFPYVSVWEPNNSECLLICSNSAITIDFDRLLQRMSRQGIKESLTEVGLDTPYALLSTFITDGNILQKYLAQTPGITDDRAQIEFFLPYTDKKDNAFDLEALSTDFYQRLFNKSQFDLAMFKANRKAMKLLRQAAQAALEKRKEDAHQLLFQAASLTPNNQFFIYARQHENLALQ